MKGIFLKILVLAGLFFTFVGKFLCYAEPRIVLTQPPDRLLINVLPGEPGFRYRIQVEGTISGINRNEIDHVMVYLGKILGPLSIPEISHDRIPPQDLRILSPTSPPVFTFLTTELGRLDRFCTSAACDFLVFAQLIYRSDGELKRTPSLINDPASKSASRVICVDKSGPDYLKIDLPHNNQIFSSRDNIGFNGKVEHGCSGKLFPDILDHFDIKVDGVEKATGLRHFSYIVHWRR